MIFASVVELLGTDNDDRMSIIHNTSIVYDFCKIQSHLPFFS